jgi:hypothetical protein
MNRVVLGGVVVSVLVTGLKMLEGSNPAEGNRFLRAIKVRSRPSFGEV